MSTEAVAYRLTGEHRLATYGGTTHLRDGLHINLHDALREGVRPDDAGEDWQPDADELGLIVTDDPTLVNTLDQRWDLERLDQVPPGSRITSHQLAGTASDQHGRDLADVPPVAQETGAMSGAEIAAAQARGDLPIPTVAPEQPADPGEPEQPADPGEPDPDPQPTDQPGHPDAAAAADALDDIQDRR